MLVCTYYRDTQFEENLEDNNAGIVIFTNSHTQNYED